MLLRLLRRLRISNSENARNFKIKKTSYRITLMRLLLRRLEIRGERGMNMLFFKVSTNARFNYRIVRLGLRLGRLLATHRRPAVRSARYRRRRSRLSQHVGSRRCMAHLTREREKRKSAKPLILFLAKKVRKSEPGSCIRWKRERRQQRLSDSWSAQRPTLHDSLLSTIWETNG